jgi:hypothetical protein
MRSSLLLSAEVLEFETTEVFWFVTPRSSVSCSSTLKMEVIYSFEMPDCFRTTRWYNPEDHSLHSYCREILRSNTKITMSIKMTKLYIRHVKSWKLELWVQGSNPTCSFDVYSRCLYCVVMSRYWPCNFSVSCPESPSKCLKEFSNNSEYKLSIAELLQLYSTNESSQTFCLCSSQNKLSWNNEIASLFWKSYKYPVELFVSTAVGQYSRRFMQYTVA